MLVNGVPQNPQTVSTDAQGKIELDLAVGTYRITEVSTGETYDFDVESGQAVAIIVFNFEASVPSVTATIADVTVTAVPTNTPTTVPTNTATTAPTNTPTEESTLVVVTQPASTETPTPDATATSDPTVIPATQAPESTQAPTTTLPNTGTGSTPQGGNGSLASLLALLGILALFGAGVMGRMGRKEQRF